MPLKLCRSTQNICYMLSHEYFKGHLNSVVKLKSTKKIFASGLTMLS